MLYLDLKIIAIFRKRGIIIVIFGDLIAKFPLGQRAENIEKAIAYYQEALEVITRQAFPYDYLTTSFNLGVAYQELKQWQLAYDTFDNAIETVEDIRT